MKSSTHERIAKRVNRIATKAKHVPSALSFYNVRHLQRLLHHQITVRRNYKRVLLHIVVGIIFYMTTSGILNTTESFLPANAVLNTVLQAQFGSPPNAIDGIVSESDVYSWLREGIFPFVWGYDWMPQSKTRYGEPITNEDIIYNSTTFS